MSINIKNKTYLGVSPGTSRSDLVLLRNEGPNIVECKYVSKSKVRTHIP